MPTSIQNGVTSLSFLFLTTLVNTFGVSASAAVGAVGKFNSFVFMPTMAMSASVSTMSAQNIGANKLDRAVHACKLGVIFSVCVSYAFFVIVQIFPDKILSLFDNDPDMIREGVTYLRSFCFDFLVIPFVFCINGMFIGGGHTLFTLINSMLSSVLIRVPLCYIFGTVFNWGLGGVGLGVPVASAASLIVIIGFLMSGRWKHNIIHSAVIAGDV
jgi:Na+-driven multidrug efflux pump